jgi:hypothetical protein
MFYPATPPGSGSTGANNRWPEWNIDYDSFQLAPTPTVAGWERLPIGLRISA